MTLIRLPLALGLAATALPATTVQRPAPAYDLILRHGTVIDGTGAPPFVADVAVRAGRIVKIGDLESDPATTELDVQGLMVAPGFINVHSHAQPNALPTAENMLTQGVTTELLNADGGGSTDVGQQLETL